MSKLLNYLNVIDQDSLAREAHHCNPEASMTQYGLNSAERQALFSGNRKAVAHLTGTDEDVKRTIVYITCTTKQDLSFA